MELRQYLGVVWKWWWLVVLSVLIAAGSSYYASSKATPLYRTKTTLMVGNVIQNPDATSSQIYTGQLLANTYAQMAKREPVLKATVESLGWNVQWEWIASQIKANAVAQTQLVEVYATDSNPERAVMLANAVARQLVLLSPSGGNQVSQDQYGFIQAQLVDLNTKISASQKEVEKLKAELDDANSARLIQDLQNQINIQDTKISEWQSTYAELMKSVEGGDVNALSIIEEATVPTAPFSPNIRMNVLLAAAIGLVLAVGGIFLIEYLDDTIRALSDTERIVNLPTLAKIGRIDSDENGSKLIALHSPLSPTADAFRMLRMNLQSVSKWQSLRTILITSVEPSVGKSLTAANLAIVMAQFGQRIILVDGDLRRPTLNTIFGVPNENGLRDLIDPLLPLRFNKSDLTVVSCLKETKVENLKILTSGSEQLSSVEALGSERMKYIVEELRSIAEVVIFDSPPALLVSDPYLLGKLVDGVLIVSRAGRTRTELLKRLVNELRLAGINLLGIVLQNRTNGEGYGYGYRYYRNYLEKEKKPKKEKRKSLEKQPLGSEQLQTHEENS